MKTQAFIVVSMTLGLTACNELLAPLNADIRETELDSELSTLIDEHNMDVSVTRGLNLPEITDPISQLGKKLFFSQSLSGDLNVACASCHHPILGGADELSLPVGANAIVSDVLGINRVAVGNELDVGRNSPTVFNTGLWRDGLFWDSRVEFVNGGISTPDSGEGIADSTAGQTLAAAQAKFPVVSTEEMLGSTFSQFEDNDTVRDHLAERIGDYGTQLDAFTSNEWLSAFQQAFGSVENAESLITFENIAHALGEYERSMVFVDSPWQQYLDGDLTALSDSQKRGARLFLSDNNDNGANCVRCHQGPTFTDESFNLVAFPQFGVKTNEVLGDVGREEVTGDRDDRYRFRTPSLLNIELTAPYGHAGTYETLADVISHYDNPQRSVTDFFDDDEMCQLPQFESMANCDTLFSNAESASLFALQELGNRRNGSGARLPNIQLSQQDQADIVEFMRALTDDCAQDIACLEPWIADTVLDDPDGQLLQAQF
jgi:cytochrome c peroxidase